MESSNGSVSNTTVASVLDPDSAFYLTGIAMMAVCLILGIPGNLAVVVVIVRHFKRDNFTLCLMLNLAVTDLLALSTIPVWICDKLHECDVPLALCRGVSFVVCASLWASVLTVCLMSLHRYLAVLQRRRWEKLGRRGELALVLGLWALACVLAAFDSSVYDVLREETGQLCVQVTQSYGKKVAVLLCETLMGFVVPVAIILSSYCGLHSRVNHHTVRFRTTKLTRTVTVVVMTFIVFWIPLHVTNVLEIIATPVYPQARRPYVYRKARLISESLAFVNSTLNPFLYAFGFRGLCMCNAGAQKDRSENSGTVRTVRSGSHTVHASQPTIQSLG